MAHDEHKLAMLLSGFARTLGPDLDIQAILEHVVTQTVAALPIAAAGVTLISSPGGRPQYAAASSDPARECEQLHAELDDGPCLAAYRTGEAVAVEDLAGDVRFARFAANASSAGFGAVLAVPLRHPSGHLGALALYRAEPGVLADEDRAAAQSLADVATAYLLSARARAETKESEQLYRSIVETVGEGIWIHDLDGTITFANLKMAALLQTTPAAMNGRSLFDFVDTSHRPMLSAKLAARGSTGSEEFEVVLRRTDGSSINASIADTPLHDAAGDIAGVLKMVTDMTARKHAEVERDALASQRRESDHLASLGQLAGGIAHDFNNLLGVISNYVTLISRCVDDPQVVADIGEINDATNKAASLTRQLLAFAREEDVAATLVDANDVLRDFERLLSTTLGEQIELRLQLDSSASTGMFVLIDPNQLERVILNLAINARDAMPRGGTLTITTDVIPHDANLDPARRWVRIRVSDTGEGMDPAVAARAFEPFFTTKPRTTGTGLGLATSYGIVAQGHGQISIESEVGRGTTIQILLPFRPAPQADRHVRAEIIPDGTETILLVEDEDALATDELPGPVLVKPVPHEVLAAAIRGAMRQRPAADARSGRINGKADRHVLG